MVTRVLNSLPAWRRAVTVLCLIAVLSPAAVGAAADPQAELDEVQRRLDEAETDLRGVEQRKVVELEDLQAVDARRAELERELATLEERLAEADAELADSSAALDATTQKLVATQGKLDDTRRQLAADQDAFSERARSTYMYGGQAQWAGIVAGLESIAEFERGLKYARSVLQDDRERVERISALEQVVLQVTVELSDLQERREAQRAVDAKQRDAAAAIVAERAEVKAQVDAEAHKRRLLVAQLESDRRSYVAMVQNLEADSRNLETQLREIAAAQRAEKLAAQRAAAAAAAEAARQAAANRDADPPPAPEAPSQPDTGSMLWPANGPKTSDYGWRTHPIFGTSRFHAGVDIGAGYGASIYAARSGVVVSAGSQGGYGNAVVIDHGDGIATLYAHQSSVAVYAGQSVSRGEVIGYAGSTGYSTGPHLHFEVRVNGSPVDPMNYF